ncbi:hypothetical protein BKA61DRAFT_602641 [Leptodontidium sp. MPI-SDFR-AT-0119]|nr:hypothetical protein BKA61DRAFT_602641 [Leptodontidium sp. MPI-SDFR-AT-0119]
MQSLTYDVAPDTECVARFAPDLSTLSVSGIVWDGIMEASSVVGVNTEAQFKTECSLLSDIAKILSKSQHGQREKDHYTSFAKTLAWDRGRERGGGTISQRWVRSFEDWLTDPPPPEEHDPVSNPPQLGILSRSEFLDAFRVTMGTGKRIFMTNGGCFGRTSCEVKSDDLVCVILGCAMPMVLRPVDKHFEVVGEVYLDVIMHGECMVAVREGKRTLQEFELH